MGKQQLIELLRKIDVVYREPVKLKHVPVSPYYIDIKKAYGYPEVLKMITEELWDIMNKDSTCIVAQGYGGISPASIIAERHNLHLTLVRDKPKQHGKEGEWLDGYIPTKRDKVDIVDDVLTTGGSLNKIRTQIEPTCAKILGYYVVVNRGELKPEFNLNPLKWLLKPEDLL